MLPSVGRTIDLCQVIQRGDHDIPCDSDDVGRWCVSLCELLFRMYQIAVIAQNMGVINHILGKPSTVFCQIYQFLEPVIRFRSWLGSAQCHVVKDAFKQAAQHNDRRCRCTRLPTDMGFF
ncbi:hypothetical protein D5S17_00995 [Pseudonocardiaceae bacterium YIM PH 21723]|nr:hypothetical protein D5S17_00995 [Pseudonocardiaceae bacterium YIM PH 21723]